MAWDFLQQTVAKNPYIPLPTIHPKQAVFLTIPCSEIFFGGAARGGKSIGLLAAALQFVDRPGYSALLLRKSYTDLALPGALMDLAQQWLNGSGAEWRDRDKQWTFPSGSTLNFGYLETENDKYRYQSASFQFIGFDELSQFAESAYTYLFSRLTRLAGSGAVV